MVRTILFDLSEVLIAGIKGIELSLAERFDAPPELILEAFGGDHLRELLHGRLSEERYLAAALELQGWQIDSTELKLLIRRNFHRSVPGMEDLLASLALGYELVLLSDHATEWVAYIRKVHPFLSHFARQFYSCELGVTKKSPEAFRAVLEAIGRGPDECLFIDDDPGNVEIARSVGVQAIRFSDSEALREDLRRLGLVP